MVTGSTEHSQIITVSNYSTIANSHSAIHYRNTYVYKKPTKKCTTEHCSPIVYSSNTVAILINETSL
jgi:hypothetical protein